jgi:hypothetical protein
MKIYKKIAVITCVLLSEHLQGLAPLNLLRPYDVNTTPCKWSDQRFQWSGIMLLGSGKSQAFDLDGNKVNDTQLWTNDQNGLAMVKGYAAGTEIDAIAQATNAINGDDGVRGHFKVAGDFKIHLSILASVRFYVTNNWWVQASLPFYKVDLKNLTFVDQTKSITADDLAVKAQITDNLAANVARLGNGLHLASWGKTGPGDLVLMAGWSNKYYQRKPWIKRVDPSIRFGLALPTGVKKDEDKVMFMPFGNDGASALIVGGGLTINYVNRIDAGFDVELMHVFSGTKLRRIKVDNDQTDFLLLTKTETQKDPGFTQKFTIFVEPTIGYGVSARFAYQHLRKGDDHLYVISNAYSSTIANTAQSLKEFTTHNIIAQLKFDLAREDAQFNRPQFTAFFVQPFNGRRSIQTQQFGLGMTLSF